MSSTESSTESKLLLTKGHYKTCHIQLQDTQERLPAIALGPELYSFFKTIKDQDQALNLLAKLNNRGDKALMTQTPKAFALWILEEDAVRLS